MGCLSLSNQTGRKRVVFTSALFLLIGLGLLFGGVKLALLHGSCYFIVAGVCFIITAILLPTRQVIATYVYSLFLLATTIWAVSEVGLDGWQLLPRLNVWFGLGLWLLFVLFRRNKAIPKMRGARGLLSCILIALLVLGIAGLMTDSHRLDGQIIRSTSFYAANKATLHTDDMYPSGDWPAFGRNNKGDHYSPLDQITPANAGQLQLAWRFRTGDLPSPGAETSTTDEDTPLKIGNMLYVCTPHSQVIALDATTGAQLWRFTPQLDNPSGDFHAWDMSCRGVSYHDDAAYNTSLVHTAAVDSSSAATEQLPTPSTANNCPRRIFLASVDARLIAINADNGQLCTDFGNKGEVNLLTPSLNGKVDLGGYFSTSPPLVTRNLVVVGSYINGKYGIHRVSGVIRAFDVHDGHLVWNWDPGKPNDSRPLAPGEKYVTNSTNAWSIITADEPSGLLYIPMGGQEPSFWGGRRTPADERFSAGVVALDIATGQLRWNYQFTHHDVWDMDVGGAPALNDIMTTEGVQPALYISSKQGSIYVLNRITGKPIVPIHEIPRPTDGADGDPISPTQPRSDLNFEPKDLTESTMWGITPFDLLYCRIGFRSRHYEGMFTPPSEQGSIIYPGNSGVFDWGGIAIDPKRQIAFVSPDYLAFTSTLKRKTDSKATLEENPRPGDPYDTLLEPFLTPWHTPCQAPPWGYVAAVDLTTHKIIWKHKNGTTRDSSPIPISLPLGVPGVGPPLVTAGGVAFIGATLDQYIRAFDISNGKQLWSARLPAGGQAGPISYRGADGRQYIVIAAGGHGGLGTRLGDYIEAYALPPEHDQ